MTDESVTPGYRSKAIPFLYTTAFIMVLACLWVTIFIAEINDYAQGIITLILGRQLGYTDQVYSYFLSTTKSSATKDATIATLSTSKESK